MGEKDGTQTNSERRVSLMRRSVAPCGDALPDWEIFARVGPALGYRRSLRGARPPRSMPSTCGPPTAGCATPTGGVQLRTGVPARLIDPGQRTVELADDEQLPDDELVLATGSRPFMPPISGVELPGVHVFRTCSDARAVGGEQHHLNLGPGDAGAPRPRAAAA